MAELVRFIEGRTLVIQMKVNVRSLFLIFHQSKFNLDPRRHPPSNMLEKKINATIFENNFHDLHTACHTVNMSILKQCDVPVSLSD